MQGLHATRRTQQDHEHRHTAHRSECSDVCCWRTWPSECNRPLCPVGCSEYSTWEQLQSELSTHRKNIEWVRPSIVAETGVGLNALACAAIASRRAALHRVHTSSAGDWHFVGHKSASQAAEVSSTLHSDFLARAHGGGASMRMHARCVLSAGCTPSTSVWRLCWSCCTGMCFQNASRSVFYGVRFERMDSKYNVTGSLFCLFSVTTIRDPFRMLRPTPRTIERANSLEVCVKEDGYSIRPL